MACAATARKQRCVGAQRQSAISSSAASACRAHIVGREYDSRRTRPAPWTGRSAIRAPHPPRGGSHSPPHRPGPEPAVAVRGRAAAHGPERLAWRYASSARTNSPQPVELTLLVEGRADPRTSPALGEPDARRCASSMASGQAPCQLHELGAMDEALAAVRARGLAGRAPRLSAVVHSPARRRSKIS